MNFDEIKAGECFLSDGGMYQKIGELQDSGDINFIVAQQFRDGCFATHLESGSVRIFEPSTPVIPIEKEFIITT